MAPIIKEQSLSDNKTYDIEKKEETESLIFKKI